MPTDQAYVAVLQWPDNFGEAEQTDALSNALGFDTYTAAQIARRGVPQIVARLRSDRAEPAVGALRDSGATALAVGQAEMARAPEPVLIRALAPAQGATEPMYACEMWRADPVTLRLRDVFLMVHAEVRSSETRTGAERTGSGLLAADAAEALMIGGASPVRSTRIRLGALVDLWLRDGTRLRIDSERFNFDVLGDQRDVTGRANAERLISLLRAKVRGAIVDNGFRDFRCPPELVRSHFIDAGPTAVRRSSDSPAFDFYSVWSWCVWRALAAG